MNASNFALVLRISNARESNNPDYSEELPPLNEQDIFKPNGLPIKIGALLLAV